MDELVLFYDIFSQKWKRYTDYNPEGVVSKLVVMCYDDLMLLYNDNRWEIITCYNESYICTTAGTQKKGIPVFFTYDDNKSSYKVPVLWRINFSPSKEVAVIYSEYYDLQITGNTNHLGELKIKSYYGNCTYNLHGDKCYAMKAYEQPSRKAIMDAYQIMVEEAHKNGKNIPMIMQEELQGDDYLQVFIKAFLYGFYDGNFYNLYNCFRDMGFIPNKCTDIYPFLCKKLRINPPKDVKDMYSVNPHVLPMYKTLLELKIKDINNMLPFLKGKKIGPIDFDDPQIKLPFLAGKYELDSDNLPADYNTDCDEITQDEIDALLNGGGIDSGFGNCYYRYTVETYSEWKNLKYVVSSFVEKKGEDIAVNYLQQYTQGSALFWQNDLCRLIHERYSDIPEDLLEKFWDKGLERGIYDQILRRVVIPVFKHEGNNMSLSQA